MIELPPLREVIARHGLSASKALGQNFLFDGQLLARIAAIPGDLTDAEVLEVGPGPGGLTRALLAAGARVTAVERDRRCVPALDELAAAYPGRLRVIEGDALAIDLPGLFDRVEARLPGESRGPGSLGSAPATLGPGLRRGSASPSDGGKLKPHVVANLPYNIGTALLVGWLTAAWPPWWASATLMFQREVADRIVAAPGTDAYGRLAVLTQWRSSARIAMPVHRSAFTPPPKVMSAVVHLVPGDAPAAVDVAVLERLTAAGFGQRRKMLRQSLKGVPGALAAAAAVGLDSTRRAETVTVAEWVALARALET